MKIQIIAFGIAKDILNGSTAEMSLSDRPTVAEVKRKLVMDYPGFSELASLRFAVNEEYKADTYPLSEGDEIVIIPPVSGG